MASDAPGKDHVELFAQPTRPLIGVGLAENHLTQVEVAHSVSDREEKWVFPEPVSSCIHPTPQKKILLQALMFMNRKPIQAEGTWKLPNLNKAM